MNPALPAAGAHQGVELDQVSVRLQGQPVLNSISLEIPAGGQVALLGPSGAGKTTLLRLLNGMVAPEHGRVVVHGHQVNALGPARLRRLRAGVGFIHQDLRLVGNLRVAQNVLSGLLGRRNLLQSLRMMIKPRSADLERVHALLQRVGIPEKMYHRADRLSGGQAQRVAVARALIQDPFLLAADEPVSSVDPTRSREVLALLTEICRQDGLTLCVSLHDPDLAREFFPRILGLRQGRVVFDGPAHELDERVATDLYSPGERDHGL